MKSMKVTDLVVDLVSDAFDEPENYEVTAEEQGREAASSAWNQASS